jgi:class 3 adenylate cyclase
MGLHSGEFEVTRNDLGGLAVHIAARVDTLVSPSEVCVSGTVKGLMVGSGISFNEPDEHVLKGAPGAGHSRGRPLNRNRQKSSSSSQSPIETTDVAPRSPPWSPAGPLVS